MGIIISTPFNRVNKIRTLLAIEGFVEDSIFNKEEDNNSIAVEDLDFKIIAYGVFIKDEFNCGSNNLFD